MKEGVKMEIVENMPDLFIFWCKSTASLHRSSILNSIFLSWSIPKFPVLVLGALRRSDKRSIWTNSDSRSTTHAFENITNPINKQGIEQNANIAHVLPIASYSANVAQRNVVFSSNGVLQIERDEGFRLNELSKSWFDRRITKPSSRRSMNQVCIFPGTNGTPQAQMGTNS